VGQPDLGVVELDTDETWVEFGPAGARRRIGFHDYGAMYSVPGLYERVFYEELGMDTVTEVVGLYGRALEQQRRDPRRERILDLGAGNGISGAAMRELGAGYVVGLDREPAAKQAAQRDRPGVYDDYEVLDLSALQPTDAERVRQHRITSLVAVAALGIGHIPPQVLQQAIELVEPGALVSFAVLVELMPGSGDERGQATGYPDWIGGWFAEHTEELERHEYVHRRRRDGTAEDAVAFVAKLKP
jgi:SAM-dependent methyltransferase